ncbi:MAG: FAD-binding and (Fe-S)-binding domain-containing protein [Candidatus Hydrogenedentales bacterium]|jgi:FAD/FMN-containing dehydrogenase/Fe-S oxidoreductase
MTNLKSIQKNCKCPVFLDDLTRQLYATDASIYQVLPLGAAFPRSVEETQEIMSACAAASVPMIPRGAGSGLAGAALGEALILDFSRYAQRILDFNAEARTVRVDAGVVLDELNAFLRPHGLIFGPDVATSSRATLGGMIANNSSGARAPFYGTTMEHVDSVKVVCSDGSLALLSADSEDMRPRLEESHARILTLREEIERRFHKEIPKRWPGYGLDRYLHSLAAGNANTAQLIGGSEGTLCSIYEATLRLVPLPPASGLVLLFFDSIRDATEATASILDLEPVGVEIIDDLLFNQTKGQSAFARARALLELDDKPCKAILLVEFYDHQEDKVEALLQRNLGIRRHVCNGSEEKDQIWKLRKSGLSLLTGCAGPAKPTAGIEDVAVPPHTLPAYVDALTEILKRLGLKASFYGHAASGLLHVRPVVDLHVAHDLQRYRQLSDEVAALAKAFRGSLTAEHGVGIEHTEYMLDQVGPELLDAMSLVKNAFDPKDLMNPGKIFDNGRWRFDQDLRQGAGSAIPIPFDPVLLFQEKDHSFVGNLEQCNGCGGCRKEVPTMCPTYQATGEESMSTRGRANIIRAVLEGRLDDPDAPLLSESLEHALSNCLSCKACAVECPSNVNLALLKAELVHAHQRKYGVPLYARVLSRTDLLGVLGSTFPGLTNALLRNGLFRTVLKHLARVAPERPLPNYVKDRFDHWFKKRKVSGVFPRGSVLLWDDCFARHNEPQIARAAVTVLEAAGYEVQLLEGHACCGRPAFSMGRLDLARRFGKKNLALLQQTEGPLIFLEPSCYAMFREDYSELGLEGAHDAAERSILFEHFIELLLRREPEALSFKGASSGVAVHVHCHAKALTDTSVMLDLGRRLAGGGASLLDSGCCGMAGAFGAMTGKYALSMEVAEALVQLIDALPGDTDLVASGTSCRQQITHCTDRPVRHFAELLAQSLEQS